MDIKKTIKTSIISATMLYLIQAVIIIVAFILHIEGIDFRELLIMLIITVPQNLFYGLFITIILYPFASLEERILNWWFVVGFTLYVFIVNFILKDTWMGLWFYQLGFILISLLVIIIFMNIKRWRTKFKSQ